MCTCSWGIILTQICSLFDSISLIWEKTCVYFYNENILITLHSEENSLSCTGDVNTNIL